MTSESVRSPIDLEWTFGDRIRKIRREVGVSQLQFAERINAGQKAVAAWELGLNYPRNIVAVAKRIELTFGVPATWTLGVTSSGPTGGGVGDGVTDELHRLLDAAPSLQMVA